MTTNDLYAILSPLFPQRFTVTPYGEGEHLVHILPDLRDPAPRPPAAAPAGDWTPEINSPAMETAIASCMCEHFTERTIRYVQAALRAVRPFADPERAIAELVAALREARERILPLCGEGTGYSERCEAAVEVIDAALAAHAPGKEVRE